MRVDTHLGLLRPVPPRGSGVSAGRHDAVSERAGVRLDPRPPEQVPAPGNATAPAALLRVIDTTL
jgi:hypothetical protein